MILFILITVVLINYEVLRSPYLDLCSTTVLANKMTSQDGRMSRALASWSDISWNPKIVGSSPEPTGSKPGRVKL